MDLPRIEDAVGTTDEIWLSMFRAQMGAALAQPIELTDTPDHRVFVAAVRAACDDTTRMTDSFDETWPDGIR